MQKARIVRCVWICFIVIWIGGCCNETVGAFFGQIASWVIGCVGFGLRRSSGNTR